MLSSAGNKIEGLKTTASTSFTLTVTDGTGGVSGTASQTLTVTLNGTNDSPILPPSPTSSTLSPYTTLFRSSAVSGTLTSTDRDFGDSATYSIGGQVSDNSLVGYDVSKKNARAHV